MKQEIFKFFNLHKALRFLAKAVSVIFLFACGGQGSKMESKNNLKIQSDSV